MASILGKVGWALLDLQRLDQLTSSYRNKDNLHKIHGNVRKTMNSKQCTFYQYFSVQLLRTSTSCFFRP